MVSVDSTTLNATWSPPPQELINGIIDYYYIRVDVSEVSEQYDYQTSETSLLITELHPYYTYTVLVAAVTVSPGPLSMGYTVQTPADC